MRSVNWLGDAVMSTSALQRLREVRPNAIITILSPEKLAGLWKDQPFVDDVMIFTAEETPLQIGRRLRWGNFDSGLIFPNSPRSALEMWFGRIPHRIGYARPWRSLFLTKNIPPRQEEIRMHKRSVAEVKRLITSGNGRQRFPMSAHHIHHYLHLVAEGFGGVRLPVRPRIFVTPSQVDSIRSRFRITAGSSQILGLNPGAEYGASKRWPKEFFIAAGTELYKKLRCTLLIFGGKGDIPLCSEIVSGIAQSAPEAELINLAGETTLSELAAAMSLCRVVITNDTGPMHLASATGARVVVPFGSTSADLTGPGLCNDSSASPISADVNCSPCFLRECPVDFRCMRGIHVSRVVDSTLAAFA